MNFKDKLKDIINTHKKDAIKNNTIYQEFLVDTLSDCMEEIVDYIDKKIENKEVAK